MKLRNKIRRLYILVFTFMVSLRPLSITKTTGNLRITVTMRRVHAATAAVEEQ
jgi:hypothetical protein